MLKESATGYSKITTDWLTEPELGSSYNTDTRDIQASTIYYLADSLTSYNTKYMIK